MALAHALNEKAKSVQGVQQWPYKAVSRALEVIPRTLLQNCGANTIRVLTALRVMIIQYWRTDAFDTNCIQAKHASNVEGCERWGVDGNTGVLADMNNLGIWEPMSVKEQTFKTALEVCVTCLLYRHRAVVLCVDCNSPAPY